MDFLIKARLNSKVVIASNIPVDAKVFPNPVTTSSFNVLFENRIQADNVYYADGHHSISTSNYSTLLNFSNAMAFYPKPCKNLSAHHCYKTANFSNSMVNSLSMLPTIPNIEGFTIRRKNGRIAGLNLLQLYSQQ